MIKHIYTKARREIEHAIVTSSKLSEQTWALISIWSGEELVTPFKNRDVLESIGCLEVLSVRFSDITKDEFEKHNLSECILFSEDSAREIIKFVDKINGMDIPDLFIHCAAGICRSGAVAAWANRYLNLDDKEFMSNNRHILPNTYVLKLLNDISGINTDYAKWWESEINQEKRDRIHSNFFG
jgi:predicted protein tyrosine phosphatase